MFSKKRKGSQKFFFVKLLIFSIIVLAIFLLVSLLLLLFIKNFTKPTAVVGVYDEYHVYRLTTYDSDTNQTERSLVSIPRFLEPEEYIHYKDSFGRINLISNFDAKEYICTGECYCADDVRRKNLVEGLIYIVIGTAALGYSMFYLGQAWTEIKSECEKTLSEEEEGEEGETSTCENPVSNPLGCEELTPKLPDPDGDDISIYFKKSTHQERESGRIFCSGHCVAGSGRYSVNDPRKVVLECAVKAMASPIELVDEAELERMWSGLAQYSLSSLPEIRIDPLATYRSWFVVMHLQPFCRKYFQVGQDGEVLCDIQENIEHGIEDSKNSNYGCYYSNS